MNNKKIACCTICKYQQDHIREFIQHNLYNVGFDFIFIGDNEELDSPVKYEEILKDFIQQKKVIVYNLRGMRAMQVKFYNIVYKAINFNEFSHIAFIDVDEFITFGNDKYKNIHEMIDKLDNADCIGLHWQCYHNRQTIFETHQTYSQIFKDDKYLEIPGKSINIKHIYKTHLPIFIHIHTAYFDDSLKLKYINADNMINKNMQSKNLVIRSSFNSELYTKSCYIKHYRVTSIQMEILKRVLGTKADDLQIRKIKDVYCGYLTDENLEKIQLICNKYNIDIETLK